MTPTFQIIAAGSDITGDVSSRFVSLDITDTVDETSDDMTLILADPWQTLALPSSGARLEVSIGWNGANQRVGSFVVDDLDVQGPPDIVTIKASSTPFVADRGGSGSAAFLDRKTRSYEGKTIGEIVRTIAGECGLTPAVDSQLAQIEIPWIEQIAESSANLLIRIARTYGAVLKPADGRLVLAAEEGGRTITGAAFGMTLTPADVSTWKFKQGGKMQAVTKVRSKSHSYSKAASETTTVDVGKGQFNYQAPEGATGEQVDAFYESVLAQGDKATGEAAAKTKAKRIERSKRSVDLTMPGTLAIAAGGKITLVGFRPGMDGDFKNVSVRQSLSRSGWVTSVTCEGA